MREIKFRAWIKAKKEMQMIDFLDFRYNKIGLNNEEYLKEFSNCELMQFTGLKDRKDRVFYEPTMGRFMTELKKCNDEGEIGEISSLSPYYTDNYKVIGNIFENSELLK